MTTDALAAAVAMARELGHVLVATADAEGMPHLAAAGKVTLDEQGRLAVGAWFCPGTVANLEENRRVAVVVWDPATDKGYQLLGRVEAVDELAILDGYAPELERATPIPQVQRQLVVRVERMLEFSHQPHTDVEL